MLSRSRALVHTQLVTIDLDTGEHRFHRPHALCNLNDTHMKFQEGRLKQWRMPGIGRNGRPSLDGSILTRSWQQTKYAGREWRPMVSLRIEGNDLTALLDGDSAGVHAMAGGAAAIVGNESQRCLSTTRIVPLMGSAARSLEATATHASSTTSSSPTEAALRSSILKAIDAHAESRGRAAAGRAAAGLRGGMRASPAGGGHTSGSHGVSVHLELPAQATGPNVWILWPTYHGEREHFNGYCEDKPTGTEGGCECRGEQGSCTHKFCKGKRLCKVLTPRGGTAAHVEAARSFADALSARGSLALTNSWAGGTAHEIKVSPSGVRASVLYDDCWVGRGRCQGFRPCAEPGDQMLTCRATAMLCGTRPWRDVLSQAKAWIPSAHRYVPMRMHACTPSGMHDAALRAADACC